METKNTNFCKCNNCDSILIDQNPQSDAELYSENTFPNATDMVELQDGDSYYWACPNCLTDSYLTDEINGN